jgi:hypothetical protein
VFENRPFLERLVYLRHVTKKATASKRPTPKSSGRSAEGAVPLSLRPEIERELDGWQEFEGDDDNCVIKGSLPYSSNPTRGVERMLRGLAELGVPGPAMRRLEGVRPALVALLKKTSLDDLDGGVLLDWLIKEAGLHFVDDLVALPPEARSELTGLLADVVSSAVVEDVSIPAFAKKVVEGLRKWAKHHALDPKRLASYQARLTNGLGGVVWYRARDAQAALVEQLAEDAVKLMRVRWTRPALALEPYSPEKSFAVGARLSHPKFGIGEVVRRLDGKIEIRFEGAVRTLAAKNDDG